MNRFLYIEREKGEYGTNVKRGSYSNIPYETATRRIKQAIDFATHLKIPAAAIYVVPGTGGL